MKQCQKTYNNIIYLRENKITIKDNAKYYELTLSTKALNKGYIQNKDTFIKEIYNYLKSKHLNKFLWNKKLLIITNYLYSFNEKRILKDTFKELGYKEIDIKPIESMLNINKEDYYLINSDNLRLLYVDDLNQKGSLELDPDILSTGEIMLLLKNRCNKKRLFIINQNDKLLALVDKLKVDYYYYEKKYIFF